MKISNYPIPHFNINQIILLQFRGNTSIKFTICKYTTIPQSCFKNPTIKNTTITGNSKDIFFGKLDHLGNPIWIKTAGGTGADQAMDIELDNQGGLYISGLFSSTAIFDGNSVTANQHSANSASYSDNYLVKYDTSGNFQWIKTGASTKNDINQNVNGYNNNTQNYYGRSKIKFKILFFIYCRKLFL